MNRHYPSFFGKFYVYFVFFWCDGRQCEFYQRAPLNGSLFVIKISGGKVKFNKVFLWKFCMIVILFLSQFRIIFVIAIYSDHTKRGYLTF